MRILAGPAAGCTPWRRARRDADGGGYEARRGTRIAAGGTAVDQVEPRSRGLAELGPTRMAEGAGASGAKPSSSLPHTGLGGLVVLVQGERRGAPHFS